MQTLKKRYGLITAICMVVGIVIGSGVFFKAQNVLNKTAGDAMLGILAWVIGGAIMVVLASTFAIMATKYEKVNGVVDYAEAICGKTFAYYIAWFVTYIYYPAMTSVLAWVSARYTLVAILGVENDGKMIFSAECILLATLYLIVIYYINALSPKIAGKFQVTTTVAKLVPLVAVALVGTVIGLVNGNLSTNFELGEAISAAMPDGGTGLFPAVCATAFAYEGWIIATAINAEIKDAKKNLPLALLIGSGIIVAIYVCYYVGVLGLENTGVLMTHGTHAAFQQLGTVTAAIINFLVVISCLGTLNGLMLGCTRGTYALAARKEGIKPEVFGEIDRKTNVPNNSASMALLTCAFWLVYFVGANGLNWFGEYGFDSSELPIITIYPLYVPILIGFMVKEKDLHPFKRFVLPILSIIGSGIMVAASILSHGMDNVYYLAIFVPVMALGAFFWYKNRKKAPVAAVEVAPEEAAEEAPVEVAEEA